LAPKKAQVSGGGASKTYRVKWEKVGGRRSRFPAARYVFSVEESRLGRLFSFRQICPSAPGSVTMSEEEYAKVPRMEPSQASRPVSIVELKRLARESLPASSALRQLILFEPDLLPADEAAVKAKMFSRLLQYEVGLRRVRPAA